MGRLKARLENGHLSRSEKVWIGAALVALVLIALVVDTRQQQRDLRGVVCQGEAITQLDSPEARKLCGPIRPSPIVVDNRRRITDLELQVRSLEANAVVLARLERRLARVETRVERIVVMRTTGRTRQGPPTPAMPQPLPALPPATPQRPVVPPPDPRIADVLRRLQAAERQLGVLRQRKPVDSTAVNAIDDIVRALEQTVGVLTGRVNGLLSGLCAPSIARLLNLLRLCA